MSSPRLVPPPLPVAWSAPPRGRVVVFAPHADDDVIGCGGASALHRAQGDPVQVVVLTTGLSGDPEGRYGREELLALREREARAGGAVLGVEDYAFWRYPDGYEVTDADVEQLAESVRAHLERVRPTLVYYPWAREAHSDHWIAALGIERALQRLGFPLEAWGYEVWTPCVADVVLDISAVVERKRAALREHASQMLYTDLVHMALGLNAQRSLYLPKGATHGEAFVRWRAGGGT
ncbi:MAG: PIG-L family deacetylase [Planctomycetes bacterium]|nr:PIG-L family deacetylase [Planctomycetota bacterium]